MTIGARVHSLRDHKGWSQEDLARESGLKRPHISLIENNERTPGADSLIGLASALETSTDYLLGLTDSPAPIPSPNSPILSDLRVARIVEILADLDDEALDTLLMVVETVYKMRRKTESK